VQALYGINVFASLATDTLIAHNTCTGDSFGLICAGARATIIGNTFSGSTKDIYLKVADGALFLGNVYEERRFEVRGSAAFLRPVSPTGVEVALLGAIDQGFVTAQIRNWSSQSEVSLDLTGILQLGETYALHHPYDLLGTPWTQGTYTGASIVVPLRPIEPPLDWQVSTSRVLPSLGIMFAAFVLRRRAES